MNRPFYIFTADHSGMPLALQLQAEGHDVTLCTLWPRDGKREDREKRIRYLKRNGDGLLRKLWDDKAEAEILRRRKDQPIVIFDQIYGYEFGERLRRAGVTVLGGTKAGYLLETERDQTLKMLKRLGVDVPEQHAFGPRSVEKVKRFLENADRLYVLKSDNPKVDVLVPKSSNDEVLAKLEADADEINADGLVLQQKVEGVELAVETWYWEGMPLFAVVDLELKRKYNEMSEVQTGCSADLVFLTPVDSQLREKVNGPLDSLAGTGLLDLSVIFEPHTGKAWALECCGSRFGYNCFYTMLTLLDMPVGLFLQLYLEGELDPREAFSSDEPYAASIRVFNDNKTEDVPISWLGHSEAQFFCWDCRYDQKKGPVTCGDEAVGIIAARGELPESAMAKVKDGFRRLVMPTKWARDDFERPLLDRFRTLKDLGLV